MSDSTEYETIALVGNPNTGKTTLFNALTGENQKVGNYSGVTVTKKTGTFRTPHGRKVNIADLPGCYTLSPESPDEKDLLWTGSDDGLVHITKNGGESWENITPKGLQECLVNAIEVSPHDPGTIYIATTRYKFNDYTPAIYKSSDYGKSWTNISEGIPYGAFTRAVREDEEQKGLLYAGTEKGLYVSWNDGKKWEPLQLNLPKTPITDLKVHQGDLIVATSGRSFWILDNITTLSQYKGVAKDLKIYKPEEAVHGNWGSQLNSSSKSVTGTHSFEGVNPFKSASKRLSTTAIFSGLKSSLLSQASSSSAFSTTAKSSTNQALPEASGLALTIG